MSETIKPTNTEDSESMDMEKSIRDGLWSKEVTSSDYVSKEMYQTHVFAQYQMVVDAADKISDRRNTANSFFLVLHSAFITGFALAIFYREDIVTAGEEWGVFIPLIPMWLLCFYWWRIVKSYRQLNTAKYKIVGEYERLLPSSPYWSAEWNALGKGESPDLYQPVTIVESRVPIVFALIYLLGALGMILLS